MLTNNFLTVWFERSRWLRALRWTLLWPLFAILFACVNVCGWLLDVFCREPRFAFNHLAIAQKRA